MAASSRLITVRDGEPVRYALATADLHSAADLSKMARDLEKWANENIQRVRRRPLLESSIALH